MMRRAAVIAVALLLAAAAGAAVDRGTIVFGQGAAGVTLGMTRAQVVAKLGKPLYTTKFGYMQYGSKGGLFDLSLDPKTGRLIQLMITGHAFCSADRICVGDRVSEVTTRFGKQVKPHKSVEETGYILASSFAGRRSYTFFIIAPRATVKRILEVDIGYCAGTHLC